jgi:hypothetical protein
MLRAFAIGAWLLCIGGCPFTCCNNNSRSKSPNESALEAPPETPQPRIAKTPQ